MYLLVSRSFPSSYLSCSSYLTSSFKSTYHSPMASVYSDDDVQADFSCLVSRPWECDRGMCLSIMLTLLNRSSLDLWDAHHSAWNSQWEYLSSRLLLASQTSWSQRFCLTPNQRRFWHFSWRCIAYRPFSFQILLVMETRPKKIGIDQIIQS